MTYLKSYFISTTENLDVITVIHEVKMAMKESGVTEGLVNVSIPAAGVALLVLENLPELITKTKELISNLVAGKLETKNKRQEKVSITSRLQSGLLGRSLSFPIHRGQILIDPKEEIMLLDFESKPKRREFYVTVMGENADAKQAAPSAAAARGRR